MPSPLADFFTAVQTTLEAVTPHDDGSGLSYRQISSPGKQGGASQHRMFAWLPSLSGQWKRGHGAEMPVLEPHPRLAFYFLKRNRTDTQFTLDLHEEASTIWRWFLAQHESGWGVGGIENAIMGPAWTFDPATSRMIFTWSLTSEETA